MKPRAIELSGEEPPSAQIIEQLEDQIALGFYKTGDRLPSSGELAAQLGVSPVTVHKAYNILMDRNVLDSRVGDGTFVFQIDAAKRGFLARNFASVITLGRNLLMSRSEIIESFESQVARQFEPRRTKTPAK